jgi:uncharacterized Zn-finger protein
MSKYKIGFLLRRMSYNSVVENSKPMLIPALKCVQKSEVIKAEKFNINCKGENDLGHPSIFINLVQLS